MPRAKYEQAERGTLKLEPPKQRLTEIGADLQSMREMFFDTPPSLEDILDTLSHWQDAFNHG
jgi:hypothetical protein